MVPSHCPFHICNFAFCTVVILFILCARKSRLYFAVGKKKRHWFAIFMIFSPASTLQSVLAVRTARIIIRGWKQAWHFQDIYRLREHRNLENWGRNNICKLQHRHSERVAYRHQLKMIIIIIQGSRFPPMQGLQQ